MSEPFLDRLSRFTPDAAGLNRDALLIAAGRSSARPNRGWMAIASLLAGTQILSLFMLWPRADPTRASARIHAALVTNHTLPPDATEAHTIEVGSVAGHWRFRRTLLEPASEYRPPAIVTAIDSGPPLRASGSIPRSLLN
jgi:hypothetical protein